MPMYEYKCANCGKRFELIQKFVDAPLTVHEECGSGPVERLISAPALQFKGTGWYVTDYAKGNGGPSDSKQKSEGGKSEGKSESKSESKSDSGKTDSSSGSKSESGAKSDSSSGSKSESSSSSKSESHAPAASSDK